jgi:hypothetical protein
MLESSVRAALLALGVAAVLTALRVKDARVSHGVWAAVILAMLGLPLWTAWGPKAVVRILPAAAAPEVKLVAVAARPGQAPGPATPLPDSSTSTLTWLYWLGAAIMLARLGLGTLRAHGLRRRAVKVQGRLTSAACATPITVGGLYPAILLPAEWTIWPARQLTVVLAHEEEHARWRDPLVQWLAQLNRALFWFHPLAWWLDRQIATLAEEACDAAVLAQTHDAGAYAESLLEMARTVARQGARIKVLGMAMPGDGLPGRIRRILQETPGPRATRFQIGTATLGCLLLCAVFAAGGVGRQIPPLRILLPELPHASLAASLSSSLAASRPAAHRPVLLAQARTPAPASKQEGRQIALVFDLGSMGEAEQANSKAAARKFIATHMPADAAIAIVALLGGTVRIEQDFTSDRDRLLGAIASLAPVSNPEKGQTLGDLQKAVELLGGIHGKKALVFFTTPLPRSDAQVQPVIEAAIRANVAFYPIDAAGLVH